ncbi:MAG: diacylglycerol kinase family lipid kinase, partial [Erysipelotrichaceae bacterium]|nr:diacylglycerol kinase family lipid kinase [Erysipelotrichaceae bacterium]
MKNVFIVNPTSGKGKAYTYIPEIEKYFVNNPGDYEIIVTEYPKHATEIASRYTEADNVILYACGGDGTMKEIIDGIQPGVRLCVIPGGTGNDFYKSVDGRKLSVYDLIAQSVEGEDIDIDYGLINGTSKFLNCFTLGLDADINVYACDYVKKELNIPDKFVYAYSAFKVGLHPQAYPAEFTVDGKTYKDDVILAGVFNGTTYGSMFRAAPHADITDGMLNGLYVRNVKLLTLIRLLLKYSKGEHLNETKYFTFFSGKKFHIKFQQPVNIQVDGENSKIQEVDIEIVKKGMPF